MLDLHPERGGTLLCLVRHGETDWNLTARRQGRVDIALNETGRSQAQMLGAYLQQWSWDAVVSSPLSRASDTAKAIAGSLRLEDVRLIDDLVEVGFGEAEGLTPEESRLRWQDDDIPGRESRADLAERASRTLEGLAMECPGKKLVVVAHGGFINAFLGVASNGEIGSGKTFLANASVSLVRRLDDGWQIEAHNVVAHLMAE